MILPRKGGQCRVTRDKGGREEIDNTSTRKTSRKDIVRVSDPSGNPAEEVACRRNVQDCSLVQGASVASVRTTLDTVGWGRKKKQCGRSAVAGAGAVTTKKPDG